MAKSDDTRQLRQDLESVAAEVARIGKRLDILEARPEPGVQPVGPKPAMPGPTMHAIRPPLTAFVAEPPAREHPEPIAAPGPPKPPVSPPTPTRAQEHVPPKALEPLGRHTPGYCRADAPVESTDLLGIGAAIQTRLDAIRARQQEVGWEMMLGTYWLPRAAVLCITVAVVFFLSLAIDRWGGQWLPHLRVAAGYGACAAMLLLAWRLERGYRALARVLYGGGFAVMYFVTFATHYVPFARIFDSPAPTLTLLGVVVIGWAVAAQMRQSKVIAFLVTVLGHITILLSTLTLERAGSISLFGLVALSAGSAFFLLRNRWYYVASVGLAATYLNAFVVLSTGQGVSPVRDFTGSMTALALFFLIYAAAELLSPNDLRRRGVPAWFRNAYAATNTAGLLLLGTLLVRHYDFTQEHLDAFLFAMSAVLFLFSVAYARMRAGDPMYNTYLVKAVTLATVGLAVRYSGNTLSTSLAVEMLALLAASGHRGLLVNRILAVGVALVAVLYTLSTAHETDAAYFTADYWTYTAQVCISVVSFLAASQIYQRTDWSTRSPRALFRDDDRNELCWQLDLVSERPAGREDIEKVLGGFLFPYLYALAGAAVFWAHSYTLAAHGYRFGAFAWVCLALTVAAWALNAKPYGLAAIVLTMGAALPAGMAELDSPATFHPLIAVGGLVAMTLVALAYELSRAGIRRGLEFHQHALAPYVLYGSTAVLAGLAITGQLDGFDSRIWLTVAAAACGLLVFVLHASSLTIIATLFLGWSGLWCLTMMSFSGIDARWRLATWILMGACIFADRLFAEARTRTRLAPIAAGIALTELAIVGWFYINADAPASWVAAGLAAVGFAMAAYGLVLRAPVAIVLAVGMALASSVQHPYLTWARHGVNAGVVLGFVLPAIFWIAIERWLAHCDGKPDSAPFRILRALGLDMPDTCSRVPLAFATGLLLIMAYRLPVMLEANIAFITIGFFAVAALFFGLSLAFRASDYRYAGLGVIVLSLARLFLIDMKEQDPLLRVAAFAVVGVGLLVISIGYHKWMKKLGSGLDGSDSSKGTGDYPTSSIS